MRIERNIEKHKRKRHGGSVEKAVGDVRRRGGNGVAAAASAHQQHHAARQTR
jgi:hypothetical protein